MAQVEQVSESGLKSSGSTLIVPSTLLQVTDADREIQEQQDCSKNKANVLIKVKFHENDSDIQIVHYEGKTMEDQIVSSMV